MKQDREKIALDILLCRSIVEVCEKNGISESTCYRIQRENGFDSIMREQKNQLFAQARATAQAAGREAVDTLRVILVDTGAPASARVSAAGKLLDMGFAVFEQEEIVDRLTELERRLNCEKNIHQL
jgi:hypothetical protein